MAFMQNYITASLRVKLKYEVFSFRKKNFNRVKIVTTEECLWSF